MNSNTMSLKYIIMKTVSKSLLFTSLHAYLWSQHEQYNHLWVFRSRAMTPPSSWTPSPCPPWTSSSKLYQKVCILLAFMYIFLVSMISIIICGYPDPGQWNILLHQLQYHVLKVHHQLQPQLDPVWPPKVILEMVMVMMCTGVLWVWDVCSGGTLHITQGGREGQTDGDVRADHPHQANLPDPLPHELLHHARQTGHES